MGYNDGNNWWEIPNPYEETPEVGPEGPWTPPGTEPEDPWGPGGANQSCPAGTSWNATEQRCIADECPAGSSWDNPKQKCMPDCPSGTTRAGNADGACTPIDYNKGPVEPTGGGSSGGYSPPKAPTRTKSPYDEDMARTLFENLQRMINGEGQPFSPEVVAKMNAGLLGSNKAQLETSQRDLQKRLIASGLSRSGVAPAEQGRLRSRADAALGDGFRQTAITAIQGNYAAKAAALAQAQTFLNSERANALSTDQLTFGYAQLSQQWKALQAQFDQQKWLANNGNEQDLLRLLLQLQNGGL